MLRIEKIQYIAPASTIKCTLRIQHNASKMEKLLLCVLYIWWLSACNLAIMMRNQKLHIDPRHRTPDQGIVTTAADKPH